MAKRASDDTGLNPGIDINSLTYRLLTKSKRICLENKEETASRNNCQSLDATNRGRKRAREITAVAETIKPEVDAIELVDERQDWKCEAKPMDIIGVVDGPKSGTLPLETHVKREELQFSTLPLVGQGVASASVRDMALVRALKNTYTAKFEDEVADMTNHDLNSLCEVLDVVDSKIDVFDTSFNLIGSQKEVTTEWGSEMLELVGGRAKQVKHDLHGTAGKQKLPTTTISGRAGAEPTLRCKESLPAVVKVGSYQNRIGAWTERERAAFVSGLNTHGRKWKEVRKLVKTRNLTPIRTHAQKFFRKVKRERQLAIDRDDKHMVQHLTQLLDYPCVNRRCPLAAAVGLLGQDVQSHALQSCASPSLRVLRTQRRAGSSCKGGWAGQRGRQQVTATNGAARAGSYARYACAHLWIGHPHRNCRHRIGGDSPFGASPDATSGICLIHGLG
jgi:SHAQKYF class myb-like DNA-binding protein